MKYFSLISLVCTLGLSLANESFSGMGSMKCYGDMSITIRIDGEGLIHKDLIRYKYKDSFMEGFLDCQPAWGSPAAPPQVNSAE